MTHTANNELTSTPGPGFLVGEMVDVTIRGARVVETYLTSTALRFGDTAGEFDIPHMPAVTFTRAAPPEWPPQPADVWSDCDGNTWVALGDLNGAVEMHMSTDITSRWSDPYEVLAVVAPMRLEYRPGWTRQPDPVPAGPVDVDKRTANVAGLQVEAEIADREADALEEPTQALQLVIADGGNGPAGLIAVAPVDEPADEGDDRCDSTWSVEYVMSGMGGNHKCELYGQHPQAPHVCLCGTEWPNAAAVVPPPFVDLGDDPDGDLDGYDGGITPVPAQRDAAE